MPNKFIGNDEIVYLKTKETSRGAHYNLYYKGHDIDKGGHSFGSEKELEDFAGNYILSNQWYNKLKYEDSIPLPESVVNEWGSSDQATFNKSMHKEMGSPRKMPSPFDDKLRDVAADNVDHYWDDWDEYDTDRDGLIDNAVRGYLRSFFKKDFEMMQKMFASNNITEGMSKSAIKKAIKVIDKQIDTETGGDGEALDNETLQALEQERERLLGMNESKFSPLGYAKRVISGEISLKAAMKEAGISFKNISKLILQLDKGFDLDSAIAENHKRKYIKMLNESYWTSYEYDKWTKENGKPKYPKWVKATLKEIVKGGFMDSAYDKEHNYMVLWLGSLDNKRRAELSTYDNKGIKEFGKVGHAMYKRFYNELTGYNMFSMMGAMYALEVSKHVQDRIANGEPVEPAYYMMKEYFNGFGMDTNRSRIFNAAYEKLEKWMKDNQIETL